MTQDVVFQGIAAPLRLEGADGIHQILKAVSPGWPLSARAADLQVRPFFSILAEPGSDQFRCESLIDGRAPGRHDAVNAVCDAMVGLALALPAENSNLICLHAAAVAMAGRLVVFPNVQRAGKSTLSAALVRAGHALFSDDVVPLSFSPDARARGHAMGLSPRLRLPMPEALGPEFRTWAETVAGPRNRQYLYLSLPSQPPRGTALPLGAFVILDRQDAPHAARLEPVGPEVAMDALLYQNFTRDRHSGDILRVMAAVLSERPIFRLRYHDLAEGVACLEREFDGWPESDPVGSAEAELTFRLADFDAPSRTTGHFDGPLRQRPGVIEVRLGDRLFLADPEGRAIHRIDTVGAAVWLVLAEPTAPEEIADVLAEAFPDAARDQIEADLRRLLAQFDAAGLTEPASP
jgi:hypothetical protein